MNYYDIDYEADNEDALGRTTTTSNNTRRKRSSLSLGINRIDTNELNKSKNVVII